jgi:hypothetical protein
MTAHARIGPSSLSRVRRCPGSVRATDGLPRKSNKAAAEGTVLHDIAADCLFLGLEPEDYVGRTMSADGHEFKLGYGEGETDPTCMVEGLDWLRDQPGDFFIEERVSLDPYMPGQFGTLDVGIVHGDTATVFDWKFGIGVLVPTVDNEQILAYGVGLLRKLREMGYPDPPRWRLIIEQPRAPGGARYYDPWEITLDELLAFTKVMEQIWTAATDPDAPRVAGAKQCYFCEAKDLPGGCAEHSAFVLDLAGLTFANLDEEDEPELADTGRITPERRSYIVRHAPMLTGWLKKLHADTLIDALSGKPTPGLKAVAGRAGNRVYTDDEAAEAIMVPILADESFTKKLKSPAQAEKLLKPGKKKPGHPEAWDDLQALITQKEGKPSLVAAEDPRPALTGAIDQFENLDLDDSTDE